jgi:hypothetical protein
MGGRRSALLWAVVVAASLPAAASASAIVARDATSVRLGVSASGRALVSYRANGRIRRVLVWGAVDARQPDPARPQVRFRFDYSGPRGAFRNRCRRYDGPPLAWLVAACKAPDGSYWALQAWQRLLPHRGFPPWAPGQTAVELHVSHWRGPLAKLEAWTDWAYSDRAHDLFGRFTYGGRPVHGFRTRPLDGYARNLYIDTLDSRYGPGWRRETSVVSRRPNGNFCYAFYPTRDSSLPGAPYRPAGNGRRYRITAIGPGVTPDVAWEGAGLPDFDPASPGHVEHERQMNRLVDLVAGGDALCRQH